MGFFLGGGVRGDKFAFRVLVGIKPFFIWLNLADFVSQQSLMDQYFARMRSLMMSKELPARIRFLLQVRT